MLELMELKSTTPKKSPIVIKFVYHPLRRDRGKKEAEPVEMDAYWKDCYNSMFKKWQEE